MRYAIVPLEHLGIDHTNQRRNDSSDIALAKPSSVSVVVTNKRNKISLKDNVDHWVAVEYTFSRLVLNILLDGIFCLVLFYPCDSYVCTIHRLSVLYYQSIHYV